MLEKGNKVSYWTPYDGKIIGKVTYAEPSYVRVRFDTYGEVSFFGSEIKELSLVPETDGTFFGNLITKISNSATARPWLVLEQYRR